MVFGTQERTHDELFKELPTPPPPTNVFLEFIDFGCSAIVGVLRQKKRPVSMTVTIRMAALFKRNVSTYHKFK